MVVLFFQLDICTHFLAHPQFRLLPSPLFTASSASANARGLTSRKLRAHGDLGPLGCNLCGSFGVNNPNANAVLASLKLGGSKNSATCSEWIAHLRRHVKSSSPECFHHQRTHVREQKSLCCNTTPGSTTLTAKQAGVGRL